MIAKIQNIYETTKLKTKNLIMKIADRIYGLQFY